MDESTVQSILQRLTKIETLLEDRVDKDYKNLDGRISKLEGNGTWLWRTVGGIIIGAIAVLLLK